MSIPIACLSAISFAIMPGGECFDLSYLTQPPVARLSKVALPTEQKGLELRVNSAKATATGDWEIEYELENGSDTLVTYAEFFVRTPGGATDWFNESNIPAGETVLGRTFIPVYDPGLMRRERMTGSLAEVSSNGLELSIPGKFIDARPERSVQRNGIKF